MRIPNSSLLFFSCCLAALLFLAGCQTTNETNTNTTANTNATPPGMQNLTVVPRPQKIVDMMKARGEQDDAKPVLKIISPAKNAVINGSTVIVKLDLSGDLKGYLPHKDPATGKGNHIHVILDNQPYEAYYELNQPFEMRNVTEGIHTLRVFPSRPWHESFKNDSAFQFVQFTVKGGGDATKPTTTKDGQTMASPTQNPAGKSEPTKSATATASATPAREGKDFPPSYASAVDQTQPLLTYSRPKGEYKGEDADPIMIDFWLSNAKLLGEGGQYRVRYTIDNAESKFLDRWEPIWLSGWVTGQHQILLELVDKDGNLVKNGGYNQTTRDITVVR